MAAGLGGWHVFKINPLTLTGGTLVLVGVLIPWFGYNVPMKFGTTYVNTMSHCNVSPFSLTMNITSTSNRTIYEDIEVLDYRVYHFHSVSHSLVGVACIAGAILGSIGESTGRSKLTLVAGFIVVVSSLLFFLLLPYHVLSPLFGGIWSTMWGFWLTVLGGILILSSIEFRRLILSWEYKD